jgi:serine/threonine protein phosphatase PrpC
MPREILFGDACDPGGRELYEDRVESSEFITLGGLKLVVGVVADGVGGENKGERAAELAKNAVLTFLENSYEVNIPQLLTLAVEHANDAVHKAREETDGASTTLALAVIWENRLYIANVGDSRIFLVRGTKLTQLTMDHTFANIMPLRGKLSREAALANPRAEVLMRALGPKDNIPVDLGFYVGTTDYEEANQRSTSGLPLKSGDGVLVCSDGLVKNSSRTGQPFARPEEIVRILNNYEGAKAAKMLISLASGRAPDDNVSAAVLQTPDKARQHRARIPYYLSGSVIAILALLLVVALRVTLQTRDELTQVSQISEATSEAILGLTQTVAAYTPTPPPTNIPTPTLRPTLSPGEIGMILSGGSPQIFRLENELLADNDQVEIRINHLGYGVDALIYSHLGSKIKFEDVNNEFFNFILFSGSNIFIETGQYRGGARLTLAQAANMRFSVSGSCMSLDYKRDDPSVIVSCFEGFCSYNIKFGDWISFLPGEQLVFDTQTLSLLETRPIPLEEIEAYLNVVPPDSAAHGCIFPYKPTPTAILLTSTSDSNDPLSRPLSASATTSPTATRTSLSTASPVPLSTTIPNPFSTNQVAPTLTNTPVPTPTNTPVPTPTNTPVPTPTNTPVPTPTNTPMTPAIDTPVPPATDTPVPPATDTPVTPATDTPVPPATDTEEPQPPGTTYRP